MPTCAELSLSFSPKIIGQRMSKQRVRMLVLVQTCACMGRCHSGREPRTWHNDPRDQDLRDSGVPPGVQGCSVASPVPPPGARLAVPLTAERWHRSLLCKAIPAFGLAQSSPNHFPNFFPTPFSPPSILNPPPRTGWNFAFPALTSGP